VQVELRRKGANLTLLWQEYKTAIPDRFQYSWRQDNLNKVAVVEVISAQLIPHVFG